ncbi:MAG: flagellar motor protein MotB [Spirochaetales bacterium]|nr:flagellar motor protein MotB [Spirochaetales bacterium]
MAIRPGKKQKKVDEGAPSWMTSFADMTNLVLTFFILLYALSEDNPIKNDAMLGVFKAIGPKEGGLTLQKGKMTELGNTVQSLPSMEKGEQAGKAVKLAIAMFQQEITSKKVRIKEDERGLIVSLAADTFFKPSSAEIDIETVRPILQKVANFLSIDAFKNNKFRIEGHTDSIPTDPGSPYPTNWELSSMRSINVLKYLVEYGVNEKQFQVTGLADTVPLMSNETEEGRAYNRRVDIVILSEGHL